MKTLKGIKLSSGCAVGRVFYYTEEHPKPVRVAIDAASAESETERVLQAMKKTSESMLEKAKNVGGEAEAIMEAHAEIASDEMLFESISELIRVTKTGAEFAVWRVYEDSARELEDSVDALRQRLEGHGLRTRMQREGKLYLVRVLLRGNAERATELVTLLESMRLGKPILVSRKAVVLP